MLTSAFILCSVEEAADPFHSVFGSVRGRVYGAEDGVLVDFISMPAMAFDTAKTVVAHFDAYEQVHELPDEDLIHFYQMEQCGHDPADSNEIADGFAWLVADNKVMKMLHHYVDLMDQNETPTCIHVRVQAESVLEYIREQRPHLLVELDL